jgi:glycosyltransferase involved in cell wall biosynthesis
MKILHCVAGNLYGGVETLLTTLARCRALAPELESAFAVCFEGRLSAQLRDLGAEVHLLGEVRFRQPWTVLKARRRLRSLIASTHRPDVLLGHSCWPLAVFGPVARRGQVPLAFWMHDTVSGTHWIERIARRTPPDLAVVNSLHTASTLPNLFPRVPSEVLPYPVEPAPEFDLQAARATLRRELDTPSDSRVVAITCRLEPWKGHALLLDALGRLSNNPGWIAWIAGGVQRPQEQVYLDDLKAQAHRLGIADRLRWLGQRSDVRQVLASVDVHCQPNLSPEPFGIAFVEALYAGLPVVSTRMGGASEIVDETCGLLVEPGSPDALAEALRSFLDDPALRARLGSGGPVRAASLSDPARVLDRLSVLLGRLWPTGPAARPLQMAEERP